MLPLVTLTGALVRLEPLSPDHVPALAAAAAESRETYGYSRVPHGEDDVRRYVDDALAGRAEGHMLPFATVRCADGRVVGSTRFAELQVWRWPDGDPRQRTDVPDVAEIGYTWLAASAQRTGANVEAKLLMLTHAFDTWRVHRVCWRTDARNERSRRAIERLGARFEGVRRAERPAEDGTVRDSAYYSVVAAEWPQVRAHLQRRLARHEGAA